MSLFIPDFRFEHALDISVEFFKENNISVIISDIDNTLVTYGDSVPTDKCLKWIHTLRENGIDIAFLSNNSPRRVRVFNEQLQLHSRGKGLKPLPGRAKKLMAKLHCKKENTCILGDQIFTDVLCGKLLGVKTVLVDPIKDKTDPFTRFKRMLERLILSGTDE